MLRFERMYLLREIMTRRIVVAARRELAQSRKYTRPRMLDVSPAMKEYLSEQMDLAMQQMDLAANLGNIDMHFGPMASLDTGEGTRL